MVSVFNILERVGKLPILFSKALKYLIFDQILDISDQLFSNIKLFDKYSIFPVGRSLL